MPKTTKSKIAWITGASSGIGRALALKMASEEWTVAATARSVASLTRLAEEAKMLPGTIYPFAADVTDSSQICSILERIENSCGAIDLAVLNAGTYVADTAKTQELLGWKAERVLPDYIKEFLKNLNNEKQT